MSSLENISIIEWIRKHEIKTETGDDYTWDNYKFMYDPMRDMHPKQAILKAAQIGFSTLAIIKAFWIAKNKRIDIIYTLPTATDVNQFAGGKINRLIAQNPILQEWVKDKDTVAQKTVGDNIIYYRGTFTQKAAMMVSSDLNIYDEVDASKQDVVEQYSTRLQASDYKWEWYFSHPSLEDFGVDVYWKKSDQHHWFITCPHCKKEQFISYPESINHETEQYICKKCKEVLEDKDRENGRWVARYKDREYRGYWIPLLINPRVSAKEILAYKRNKTPEYFFNKVLGLPYSGSQNKVSRETIMQNVVEKLPDYEDRIVIGGDTGLTTHLVVGNASGIFYISSKPGYDDLEMLLKRFPTSIAVLDAQGDLQKPRDLQEKYPNRIWLCYYRPDRKSQEFAKWNEDDNTLSVDRNQTIQLVIDEYTGKRIPLLGTTSDYEEYWEHWKNIYAEVEENSIGVPIKKWKRNGDDHLVHGTVYWRIGMDRFGKGKGLVLGAGSINFGTKRGYELNPAGLANAPDIKKLMKINKKRNWKDV